MIFAVVQAITPHGWHVVTGSLATEKLPVALLGKSLIVS